MLLPVIISPFGIYLCRVFAAASVPVETIEAARLDGAGECRIFTNIGVPMMIPGMVTVFMLQFVGIWNNFLLPFIMLSDQDKYPLTVGLYTLLSQGLRRAGAVQHRDHRRGRLDHPARRAAALPAALLAARPASAAGSRDDRLTRPGRAPGDRLAGVEVSVLTRGCLGARQRPGRRRRGGGHDHERR